MNKKHLLAIVLLLLTLPTGRELYAGLVSNVTVVGFSSEYANGTDQRRATNVVNGSGLYGDVHTPYYSGCMWLDLTAGAYSNAFIILDLGSVRTLEAMRVWNYNELQSGANILTRRGIQRADILTAGEDLVFTTNLSNVLLNQGTGTFTNSFAQVISLGGIQARYVRINALTNYSGVVGQVDTSAGLSKVQFFDTNLAPAVLSATRSFSNDRVTVTFGESVTAASATVATNYSILLSGTNAATVLSATMDTYNNVVFLQTSTLASNLSYTLQIQNVRGLADNTRITNAQIAIVPEIALWLKADAGVTADGSGFVTQWNDQSGNGNNAFQPSSDLMPTLVNGALNGHPVLHFDGVDDYMDVAHTSSLVVRRDVSVFAVASFDDFANFNGIIGKTVGNSPAPLDFYTLSGSGAIRLYRGNPTGNNGANALVTGTQNPVAAQAYIISGIVRGTNATQYLDGAFKGSARLIAGILDAGGPLRVGSRDDLVTKLKGNLAEVILVRGAVSDAERVSITGYLGSKYGISVINLVFNQQPTNTTSLEGQTATFYVNVSASSPDITYQWQRYGTNLPNATNVTYTTPILTQADNNSTFRVQVSIPGSSQFSDTAILTVLADAEKPTVVSAGRKIWSPSEIVVVYSEPVTAITATNAASYSLDNGATVNGRAVGDNASQVVLSTSGMTNGGSYMLTVQNVKDLFNNTIVTTQVPLMVYPAAALWLSAGAGVTTDVDGYVSQWYDLSGNGNHALAAFDAPARPSLVTNGFNGQAVLRFAGAGEPLLSASSPSLAIVGDISIYAVVQYVDFTTYNAFVGKTTVNLPASYDFYLAINSGQPVFYRGDGFAANASVAGASSPSLGVPHIVSAVMGGTGVAHYLDGLTNGTGTLSTVLGDNGDPVGIGTRNDGVTRMKGDVAEMLIFGSALSVADRLALDNYFGAKYGILVGSLPRISIVGNPGGTVLLSWPTPAQPFNLESATNIVAAPWATVTNSITSSGGTNSATINAIGNQQFFRLHKP